MLEGRERRFSIDDFFNNFCLPNVATAIYVIHPDYYQTYGNNYFVAVESTSD